MDKKGQLKTFVSAVIVFVVVLSVLFIMVPKITGGSKSFLDFFKRESPRDKAQAEGNFEKFVSYYKECKGFGSNNCMCRDFDLGSLPDGYYIKLLNTGDRNTRIELYKEGIVAKDFKEVPDDRLCIYRLNRAGTSGSPSTTSEIILSRKENNNFLIGGNKIQLFRSGGACIIETTAQADLSKIGGDCFLKEEISHLRRYLEGLGTPVREVELCCCGRFAAICKGHRDCNQDDQLTPNAAQKRQCREALALYKICINQGGRSCYS